MHVRVNKLVMTGLQDPSDWGNCLLNRKFVRLGGPFDEIVTVFVHKYNVIMPRLIVMSWCHLIRETGCQDVGCFIIYLKIRLIHKMYHVTFHYDYMFT